MKFLQCWLAVALITVGCSGKKKDAYPNMEKPNKGDLIRAIIANDHRAFDGALLRGADVNENIGTASNEITPLLTAVAYDHQQMAFDLIERGAATHPAYEGFTAKDFAYEISGDFTKLRRTLKRYEIKKTTPSTEAK